MSGPCYGETVSMYCLRRLRKIDLEINELQDEKHRLKILCSKYANSSMSWAEFVATQAEPFQKVQLPE